MNILSRRTLLACALVASACGGKQTTDTSTSPAPVAEGPATDTVAEPAEPALPTIPAQPVAMPSTVLVTGSVGDPQGQLAEMAAFADQVQPGLGAALAPGQLIGTLAMMARAAGLDGVDLSKPVYGLVLDQRRGGGDFVLVVGVADPNRLIGSVSGGEAKVIIHDGFAAIGSVPSLGVGAPYALSALVKESAPAHPRLTIHVNHMVEAFGAELRNELVESFGTSQRPAEKALAQALYDGFTSLERIEASFQVVDGSLEVAGKVMATSNSALGGWFGSQKPSEYQAMSRLPAGPWLAIMAGRIELGSLGELIKNISGQAGVPVVGQVVDALGNEMAVAVYGKGKFGRAAFITQLSDGKAVSKMLADTLKQFAGKPMPVDGNSATLKLNAARMGGASMHSVVVRPGADASAEAKKEFATTWGKGGMQSYFGVAGDYLVAVLDNAKDARKNAGRLAQNARAKAGKNAAGFAELVAESKKRGESGAVLVDFTAMAPNANKDAQLVFGVGFAPNTLNARMTIPAATAQLMVQQAMMQAGF